MPHVSHLNEILNPFSFSNMNWLFFCIICRICLLLCFAKYILFKCGVKEVAINEVCEAFKVARGMVQALQENAGRFASMVTMFCERLGWHDLEGLVGKFQNRVSFGVRAEIVELTTIPFVKVSELCFFCLFIL